MPLTILSPQSPHDTSTPIRRGTSSLDVGLINSMPDPALQVTERQFCNLLKNASESFDVRLKFFSLPEVPRSEPARRRISDYYYELSAMWDCGLDALIVTGTEPLLPDLTREVYWNSLVAVIDWARTEVRSSIWSCLAAHAAVLYLDGVKRQKLSQKCFGVFEHQLTSAHLLTHGMAELQLTPHSRWNDVARSALQSCGYDILTHSSAAGVNLFSKRVGGLFVCLQGHPEYEDRSLLKEYQRDILRFLRRERGIYPNMPQGYFSSAATEQLAAFQARAVSMPTEGLMDSFPIGAASAGLKNTWHDSAVQLYRNWLGLIAKDKAERAHVRAAARVKS